MEEKEAEIFGKKWGGRAGQERRERKGFGSFWSEMT